MMAFPHDAKSITIRAETVDEAVRQLGRLVLPDGFVRFVNGAGSTWAMVKVFPAATRPTLYSCMCMNAVRPWPSMPTVGDTLPNSDVLYMHDDLASASRAHRISIMRSAASVEGAV